MAKKKNWSVDDVELLRDKWGSWSLQRIANKLDRTVSAVKQKAYKIGLEPYLLSGEYVYLKDLVVALGYNPHNKLFNRLIANGLKVHSVKNVKGEYKMVLIPEFWKWLNNNKNAITLEKMEKNALGDEPKWVAEKRRMDKLNNNLSNKRIWTSSQINLLISKANSGRYTVRELAVEFRRSESAIRRKLWECGVLINTKKTQKYYTKEEELKIKELVGRGFTPYAISLELGRAESGVIDKIKRLNLQK